MTTLAEVKLWGKTIGAVALEENETIASFQYDDDFAHSQIEISPIVMPLSKTIYSFPELSFNTFHGLPGLLVDSLPDRYGNALIDAWLTRQGRKGDSFNAVERLCYTGQRGMGALEFHPTRGPDTKRSSLIKVDALVQLASDILSQRSNLKASFGHDSDEIVLKDILQVGTSAGGARAKAVIAWNESTGEIRSGQVETEEGFNYWLMKFDGVSGNRDKELNDPLGFGAIEYAYYKMALAAGITMNRSILFEENGRRHFMTKRFDRSEDGKKVHMQSLGALAHYDFNAPGVHSYEEAFSLCQKLGLPMESIEELFRRMTFNIIARNQDDHVKNIAFLMDKRGTWSLAPAFDVTYSYNPTGLWTSQHQMSMNGKRDDFNLHDFKNCGKNILLKRGRAESIVEEVQRAVGLWPQYASEAAMLDDMISSIEKTFRYFL